MPEGVHYIAFDEIGITVAVIAAAMAFVVLAWNAVKAIHDWRAMTKKPTDDRIEDHERRISHLEECCDEVKGKLQNDWAFQQAEVEMNQLLLKSIKQLLKHAIDGNDTAGLEAVECEIDDYLMKNAM